MIGEKLTEYFKSLMFTEPMGLLWVTIADLGALIERDGVRIEDDLLSERYIRCLISSESSYVKFTKTLEKDIYPQIVEECERALLGNNDRAVKGYIKEVARQVNKLERALSEINQNDMERLKAIALDRDNPKHPIYEAVLLYLSICKIELKYINDLFTTKIRDYELGNFNDYKQRELEHLESSNTPTPKASEPLKQLCYPLEKRAHKRVINAGSKERRKERTEKYINKILKMENNRARPRAEAEPQSREPQLPTELDNDGAKEIFAKAVEVGLMEIQGNGYKWNRSKVLLAYMLNKIYTGVFPATDLDKLFGVSGLKQAVYSLPNNKKPPKGYKEIDILFKEA